MTPPTARRLLDLYALKRSVEAEIKRLETARVVVRKKRKGGATCGTDGGYYRHIRTLSEIACPDCLAAHREYERARAARARGAA